MAKISKGLDLPFKGSPDSTINTKTTTYSAIVGHDYKGLKPKMMVSEGDTVSIGQPLFVDKRIEGANYCSPVSGVVSSIQRGSKRVLQNVIVKSEADNYFSFDNYKGGDLSTYSSEDLVLLLLESGSWTSIKRRPFSIVANPSEDPSSIFVTAIDSNPLSFDPSGFIQKYQVAFNEGLRVLEKIKNRPVHVCVKNGYRFSVPETDLTKVHEFSGPHPSGNAGTHIHHIDPVATSKCVWTIGFQDVVAIGKLISTGRFFAQRWTSLAGPGVKEPKIISTNLGADITEIIAGELKSTVEESRVINGSVLTGKKVDETYKFLGRFSQIISVLKEDRDRVFLGWHDAGFERFSVMRTFLSKLTPTKRFSFGTSTHGSYRAMVPVGAYEKVFPFDMLPTLLLKALCAGDTDDAQALGCLELDEEDLALCTFVDPGKVDYGPLLRKSLSTIEKEG
jgi:Na+-transporting NADH:ubiquinone oxidoreductase subunit A